MRLKKQFFGWMVAGLVLAAASGCKKDKEDDQTAQVVGTYMGSYAESTDGSTVTVDEVETVVTKESASRI